MPNVPYPYKSKWQIGQGKWFLNTNKFLIKPFLIAKFDCNNISFIDQNDGGNVKMFMWTLAVGGGNVY